MRAWLMVSVSLIAVFLPAAATAGSGDEGSLLETLDVQAHGFLDVRAGRRTQSDPVEQGTSLSEVRLQLDLSRMGDRSTLQVRADFLYDHVDDDGEVDLEEGTGPLDLREANVQLFPVDFADVKIGRQILTWGTGDLLFINDLFPKDWRAFFIGRDVEYLKAPSDALFVSLFPPLVNIDIAYTPRLDADRYIRGERLSYWNPALGRRAGRDAVGQADAPDEWFRDDEVAVRVSRNVGGYEIAGYGYDGFWKSPQGADPVTGAPAFNRLSVYGASVRGAVGSGLFNVEGGIYRSDDDSAGEDPLVPNDEARLLAGYEREVVRNLTAGIQYYLEYMDDYDAYRGALPPGARPRDEYRHVATARLTYLALDQDLTLSLFSYYSPSDRDAYIRPSAKLKLSDAWMATVGANIFTGWDEHTFFGQFENNSNVYAGTRYSF